MLQKKSIRRRVLITLAVAVLCLATLVGLVARHYAELLEAGVWSNHTYLVIDALRNVEAGINSDRGLPYCAVSGDLPSCAARCARRTSMPAAAS